MQGLPLADIVEVIQPEFVLTVRPAGLVGHALVERPWLSGRQVPDERGEALGEVRLGRSGQMALHRLPR